MNNAAMPDLNMPDVYKSLLHVLREGVDTGQGVVCIVD